METQLFDWEHWDQCDLVVFQFYPVTLKVQIGPHAPGTKLAIAVVDWEHGLLRLYVNETDQKYEEYRLNLYVE